MVALGYLWYWLALNIAVGTVQTQNNFQNSTEIIFPGPTERPDRFPLSSTTLATSVAYEQCFNNCRVTSEYNPVCGTDNVVYSNPGRLKCARYCGRQVEIRKYGQCQS